MNSKTGLPQNIDHIDTEPSSLGIQMLRKWLLVAGASISQTLNNLERSATAIILVNVSSKLVVVQSVHATPSTLLRFEKQALAKTRLNNCDVVLACGRHPGRLLVATDVAAIDFCVWSLKLRSLDDQWSVRLGLHNSRPLLLRRKERRQRADCTQRHFEFKRAVSCVQTQHDHYGENAARS